MEGLQARPHVVALWVGAHEPGQTFESVANQLRLTQLLGHYRYPLVRRPELGIISFHLHLPFGSGTFYATTGARLLGRPQDLARPSCDLLLPADLVPPPTRPASPNALRNIPSRRSLSCMRSNCMKSSVTRKNLPDRRYIPTVRRSLSQVPLYRPTANHTAAPNCVA